ncbi:DUF58 domain-containing protein, partial [Protaetiibacter sp. 10F1B-8-1]|nr:DUF58 domain-containing protein [Protaetiibacter mangrovi]
MSRPRSTGASRDTTTPTDATGLGTTRARIVGARTGVLADAVVGVVRGSRAIGRGLARAGRRLSSVVTPLGWVIVVTIPAALALGYALGWLEFVAVGWAALVLA